MVTYKEVGKSWSTDVLDDVASLCPIEEKNTIILYKYIHNAYTHNLASVFRYLPVFACIFIIHFFIKKRDGALSRYSEPSRRLQARGRKSR